MTKKAQKRFLKKFLIGDDCWEWTATKNSTGYASFYLDGHMVCAHRIAYQLWVGEIPKGFEVDHLCFNKACVNPEHLEAVSPSENTKRAWAAGRCSGNTGGLSVYSVNIQCAYGHLRNEYGYRTPQGILRCRACRRIQDARQKEKRRARK